MLCIKIWIEEGKERKHDKHMIIDHLVVLQGKFCVKEWYVAFLLLIIRWEILCQKQACNVHVGDLLRFHLCGSKRYLFARILRGLCHGNAINASVEQTNTGLEGTTRMGRRIFFIVAISHVYNRNKRHIDLKVVMFVMFGGSQKRGPSRDLSIRVNKQRNSTIPPPTNLVSNAERQ